jgi:hypothetical protein
MFESLQNITIISKLIMLNITTHMCKNKKSMYDNE